MKGKISLMWRVTIAMVLVLSFSLVAAVPAAASPDLDEVKITVTPPTATATAKYQVDFFVHTGLTEDVNCFVIEFPTGTTVPSTIATTDVEIYDITEAVGPQKPFKIEIEGQLVRVYMQSGGPGIMAFHYGRVVFTLDAGIKNPAATGVEEFCAWVYSDPESEPVEACYYIYETVPIDVFLKYQIPPVECGYVEDILVGSFLTIGEAVDFADDLYLSGDAGFKAVFVLEGVKYNTTTPWYGTMDKGSWDTPVGQAIGDGLDITSISWTEDETFDITCNLNDGTHPTTPVLVTDLASIPGVVAANVVDVVSVVGAGQGATPGYQNTFKLTGDTYNKAAGAYGDFGVTTAGWTDGTSIGEALTVDVTTKPSVPETYTVTYNSDDATKDHIVSLTVQTDGTYVWSPAAPLNVVDITNVVGETPAWLWYEECPTEGGLIGARVLVKDGIYMETFTIRTPGVMVESENGAADTIIDASGLTPAGAPATQHIAAVMITAEGVTFGGTGKGFTVKNAGVGVDAGGIGADSTLWADENSDGIADVSGVYIWPNGGAYIPQAYTGHEPTWCRVNVIDNIIYGSQGTGIFADADDGTFPRSTYPGVCVYVGECTVYDNLFDGFHGEDLCVGPLWLDPGYTFTPHPFVEDWGYTAIVDNEFYLNGGSGMGTGYKGWTDAGIEIGSTVRYVEKTCYIVDNNIHDNVHAGIHLMYDATGDIVVIKFNQIVDNGVFGISTKADYPDNIACVYNNIAGNTDWGIKNWEKHEYLVATLNWWGDKSGPSDGIAPEHPSEPNPDQTAYPPALGTGDAVSHYVIYQWWLTYPFEDVQADLIRYYGSDRGDSLGDIPPWTEIVPLVEGWNTMSTPVALDERADQMGEIVALGGWMQNYVLGYSYTPWDPEDPESGWLLIGSDYQLLPLEAIYVRMSGPDFVPILLRNTNYMPARVLEPGWNLVGLNVGFWSQDIQSQKVDVALASISGSWSNAISPNMPGQEVTWVCTTTDASTYGMYIGDGYWVFITKQTTLAGIRMAPWYLDDWEMDILNCVLPPWM